MPRRYNYRRVVNRDKYSVEETAGTVRLDNSTGDGAITVVPSNGIQGMRKVKHITVSLACTGQLQFSVVYWALVYIPEGVTPSALNITAGNSMYEPNQYVMNCGVCDFDGGPTRFSSPLSRNLNSGDQIVLILKSPTAQNNFDIYYCARYAVTLQ